jgi:DNA-directed RNA polymerase specialized sigma24 family protein|tara:strand:- start:29 stop:415 length:387 start_codon:yes stop_codon:yes gene_type:complete
MTYRFEPEYSPDQLAERFTEAARVLKSMPSASPKGHAVTWPDMQADKSTDYADEKTAMRLLPSPGAIGRLDEVLTWSAGMPPDDRKVVWGRAAGVHWKWVARRLGCSVSKAQTMRRKALEKLACRLCT